MPRESAELRKLVEPAVTALGYELVGVEFFQGKTGVLRIYIDSVDSDEGIGVDDCSAVSHQVSGILEVEDPIRGQYSLEVSSPGLGTPFIVKQQYEMNTGRYIDVLLSDGSRVTGKLKSVQENGIVLQVKGKDKEIEFLEIKASKAIITFN